MLFDMTKGPEQKYLVGQSLMLYLAASDIPEHRASIFTNSLSIKVKLLQKQACEMVAHQGLDHPHLLLTALLCLIECYEKVTPGMRQNAWVIAQSK